MLHWNETKEVRERPAGHRTVPPSLVKILDPARNCTTRQETPEGAPGLNQGMGAHVMQKAEARITSCIG